MKLHWVREKNIKEHACDYCGTCGDPCCCTNPALSLVRLEVPDNEEYLEDPLHLCENCAKADIMDSYVLSIMETLPNVDSVEDRRGFCEGCYGCVTPCKLAENKSTPTVSIKVTTSRVMSGRDAGKMDRDKFNLDELEETCDTITVNVSEDIFAVTSSYFMGLFEKSIEKYSDWDNPKGFFDKYKFTGQDISMVSEHCVKDYLYRLHHYGKYI